jgi:hypothetical protein
LECGRDERGAPLWCFFPCRELSAASYDRLGADPARRAVDQALCKDRVFLCGGGLKRKKRREGLSLWRKKKRLVSTTMGCF